MSRQLAATVLILALSTTSCESQDAMDQRNLRRHFALSRDTALLEYVGYPKTAGFGQREGLVVQAIFQLPETEVTNLVQNGGKVGWRSLPIPQETVEKLPYNTATGKVKISMPFTSSQGLFLCKTVGDDVLNSAVTAASLCENQAGTLKCTELIPLEEAETSDKCKYQFNDQILGILELDTRKLFVFIGSTY